MTGWMVGWGKGGRPSRLKALSDHTAVRHLRSLPPSPMVTIDGTIPLPPHVAWANVSETLLQTVGKHAVPMLFHLAAAKCCLPEY